MERYEINQTLTALQIVLHNLEQKIDLKNKKKQIDDLMALMEKPNFWTENKDAIDISQKLHQLQNKISNFNSLKKKYDDLATLFVLVENENDKDLLFLIEELKQIQKEIKDFEIEVLLNQPYDENNAILILHSGAGGTESQDWCEMLTRMYQKYAQRKKFQYEILHSQPGEEAGLKTATILIKGPYAYGYLKAERGVHRLVRVSPFDSGARRHTSFASCEILPEINEDIQIEIKDEDIKVDVYRSSGAGGQHVNTTDSAVRITHLPTNTVVTCQNERSQIKNREKALQILKTKLLQIALKEQEESKKNFNGEQKDISWGSQIRSYVFHPYQMVKDHRTNYEYFQIDAVMDGFLDDFINAFLRQKNDS
ncbi:MAG: peptide chain release factor 2 [Candidatus Phytoplasma pruni]|uniref:peptide chain release factor 2 n=1 Tax=Milkweed yellows phytoplasma TaxID=208434 RepID=UPI0004753F3A|nr:peptide chain release factor 2 [Milkweed yellows phytoplasma]